MPDDASLYSPTNNGAHTAASAKSKRRSFQPMNINYGLLPPAEAPKLGPDGKRLKGKDKGFAKKRAASERALRDLEAWLAANDLKVAAE